MNINDLLVYAVEHKASDVHISIGIPPAVRINGRLTTIEGLPNMTGADTEEMVNAITSEKQKAVLAEKGHLDFAYVIPGEGRYRVNVFKQRGTFAIVARIISINIPPFESLNLPDTLKDFTKLKKGMVLVTGPTGSGKSTTLASMIDIINRTRREHVITLEDPVEYLHRHNMSIVNQREIGIDAESYEGALRAALREDPDVILVGEMRDLETIRIAITAAETGHIVFSTLHTIGAARTVDRIIDVFPPHHQQQIKIQLASVLSGVVSQQLVPKRDGKGRIAALEIMKVTPAIRNLIREGKNHQIDNCIQTGAEMGMISMNNSLANLYKQGMISRDEAFNYSLDHDELKRILGVY